MQIDVFPVIDMRLARNGVTPIAGIEYTAELVVLAIAPPKIPSSEWPTGSL